MKRTILFFCPIWILFALLPGAAAETSDRPPAAAGVAPQRILGVFGGMGPEATANFYQEIVRLTPAKTDQEHIPVLIYSFPQVPDRTAAIHANDRSIIPFLVEGVTRLEKAGASLIAIPCNTAHYYHEEMQKAVSIPILNMIREAADAVSRENPGKSVIGLLATSGTLSTGLYQKELTARGYQVLVPSDDDEATLVMRAIYAIKAGEDKAKCEEWLAIAGEHLEKRGAQVIVLGCTEIPLAFNPRRSHVPVVNATRALAEAAIRRFRDGK